MFLFVGFEGEKIGWMIEFVNLFYGWFGWFMFLMIVGYVVMVKVYWRSLIY